MSCILIQNKSYDKMKNYWFNSADIISIILRFAALVILIWWNQSQTTVVSYIIRTLIFGIVSFETYQSYKVTKSFIFTTFSFLSYWAIAWRMMYTGTVEYAFSLLNIVMLAISAIGLILRSYIKANSLYGTDIMIIIQLLAMLVWSIVYCVSIVQHPNDFSTIVIWHRVLTGLAWFIVTINALYNHEKLWNLIFNIYGFLVAIIYISFIIFYT